MLISSGPLSAHLPKDLLLYPQNRAKLTPITLPQKLHVITILCSVLLFLDFFTSLAIPPPWNALFLSFTYHCTSLLSFWPCLLYFGGFSSPACPLKVNLYPLLLICNDLILFRFQLLPVCWWCPDSSLQSKPSSTHSYWTFPLGCTLGPLNSQIWNGSILPTPKLLFVLECLSQLEAPLYSFNKWEAKNLLWALNIRNSRIYSTLLT